MLKTRYWKLNTIFKSQHFFREDLLVLVTRDLWSSTTWSRACLCSSDWALLMNELNKVTTRVANCLQTEIFSLNSLNFLNSKKLSHKLGTFFICVQKLLYQADIYYYIKEDIKKTLIGIPRDSIASSATFCLFVVWQVRFFWKKLVRSTYHGYFLVAIFYGPRFLSLYFRRKSWCPTI